jgi:hypothetical protein
MTSPIDRRTFIRLAGVAGTLEISRLSGWLRAQPRAAGSRRPDALQAHAAQPGRIANEYTLFLPGEREALAHPPLVRAIERDSVTLAHGGQRLAVQAESAGWRLLATPDINGSPTAVFEKHVTHRGVIAYVTVDEGVIALIPKYIGDLASIRPRQIANGGPKLVRAAQYTPGPDTAGDFILASDEDPSYENVAGLGAEYIGWALVANEEAGPLRSLFLDPAGKSRQLHAADDTAWAPDQAGYAFDPADFLNGQDPQIYDYLPGYSKRTLLGGYLPAADIGVWNPEYKAGYECIVLLPPGVDAAPMGRIRSTNPAAGFESWTGDQSPYLERFFNASPDAFYAALVGIWNQWRDFYNDAMPVEIPDEWLLNAARAGITLARCSYRGLHPTYQIGEGGYTKIPERSHALFPVAHYEFVWAQQLWGLSQQVEPYFQFYLENYILPDGNFLYNTQDQVEAPLNTGIFLWNAARAYDYTGDAAAFERKLPVLERMLAYVLARYEYSKRHFPPEDRHYGLIWGSPEADLGDPQNDYPQSHPYYFQNAVWTWRGLVEHARVLARLAGDQRKPEYLIRSQHYAALAAEMRPLIQRSIEGTIDAGTPERKAAGITPYHPSDTTESPRALSSYQNHRFMMDFFTADWGDPRFDLGYLKQREIAGMQILGMGTDGAQARVSNFMEHGTLSVKIRQEDYRPFLLTLYGLASFTSDSGNFYSPEDAFVPGSYPGEGSIYGWSAVVNSVLQPTMGLRWLLCYEESDRDLCHLQKAAPRHWFASGQRIAVQRCPTRFGPISWTTEATAARAWTVTLNFPSGFNGDLAIHIHPPDGQPLRSASAGQLAHDRITLRQPELKGKTGIQLQIT